MTLVFDWKFDLVLEASTSKIKDKQLPGRKISPSSASAAHTAAGFLRRSNFGAAAAAEFNVDGSLVDGAPSVPPLPSKRVSQASLWRCTAWGNKQRVRIFWGQESEMFVIFKCFPLKKKVLNAKTFAFWKWVSFLWLTFLWFLEIYHLLMPTHQPRNFLPRNTTRKIIMVFQNFCLTNTPPKIIFMAGQPTPSNIPPQEIAGLIKGLWIIGFPE